MRWQNRHGPGNMLAPRGVSVGRFDGVGARGVALSDDFFVGEQPRSLICQRGPNLRALWRGYDALRRWHVRGGSFGDAQMHSVSRDRRRCGAVYLQIRILDVLRSEE